MSDDAAGKVVSIRRPRFVGSEAWKNSLRMNEKKTAYSSDVGNALTILANDPSWRDVLEFDDFRFDLATRKSPPWDDSDVDGADTSYATPQPWSECDTTRAMAWMCRKYGVKLSAQNMWLVLAVTARRKHFHPVREYLNSLRWDGVQRIPTWLHVYFGSEHSTYHTNVGIWFLVGAVARVFNPGVKHDCAPVFEGAQGIKKSSALRALFGAEWSSDSGVDLSSKDRFIELQGLWLLEFQEYDSFSKADDTKAKAYMSSPVDRYRPLFERKAVAVPRQCVFAATTNVQDVFKDTTGNRRWWPIACTSVNLDAIERDRDMMWAEAVEMFRSGCVKWWPDSEKEQQECRLVQASRVALDVWQEKVETWVELNRVSYPQITVPLLLEKCLGIEAGKWGKPEQTRIGNCIRMILDDQGKPLFHRRQVRIGNVRSWVYERRDDVTTATTDETDGQTW